MAMQNPGSAGRESLAHRETRALLPAETGSNVSDVFVVQEVPTVIRAFGLDDSDRIIVEMVDDEACEEERFAPFCPKCGCVMLSSQRNVRVLALPGRYRLVLIDKDGSPITAASATRYTTSIRVTAYRASINQEFVSAYV
jgi:hypothetical protein